MWHELESLSKAAPSRVSMSGSVSGNKIGFLRITMLVDNLSLSPMKDALDKGLSVNYGTGSYENLIRLTVGGSHKVFPANAKKTTLYTNIPWIPGTTPHYHLREAVEWQAIGQNLTLTLPVWARKGYVIPKVEPKTSVPGDNLYLAKLATSVTTTSNPPHATLTNKQAQKWPAYTPLPPGDDKVDLQEFKEFKDAFVKGIETFPIAGQSQPVRSPKPVQLTASPKPTKVKVVQPKTRIVGP